MPYMKDGSPFLFDDVTGDIVGIKDPDGSEHALCDLTSAETASVRIPLSANDALRNIRKRIGRVRAGTGRGKILCIGGSLTTGHGAAGVASAGAKAKSYPTYLAAILAGAGLITSTSNFCGGGAEGALPTYDTRWSLGTGWKVSGAFAALGQACLQNGTDLSTATYTCPSNVDTIDLYYVTLPGGGTFTIDVSGAGTTSINTAGTTALVKQSLSFTVGATINIIKTGTASAPVYIEAFDAYLSTSPGLSIINAGWSGVDLPTFFADTTNSYAPVQEIKVIAPDLTIIDMTENAWLANATYSVATWQKNLATLIAVARQSGDVIVATGVPSGISNVSVEIQETYTSAVKATAISTGAYIFDDYARFGSYVASSTEYFDTIHLLAAGYAQRAQALSSILLS